MIGWYNYRQPMGLIDSEGNLFGVVNVVDALVVALVAVVVVSGVGFVLSQGDQQTASTSTTTVNVTIDLGSQPSYLVSQLNEGDSYSPTGRSKLTLTDVYLAPGSNSTRAVVRARLRGIQSNTVINYDGAPPRLGRTLTISTTAYNVSGTVRDVGGPNALTTNRTTVLLRMTTSDTGDMVAGKRIRLSGRTVATVEDVVRYDGNAPGQQVVYVESSLRTYRADGRTYFGSTPLHSGSTVRLPTGSGDVSGEIQRVGPLNTTTTEVLVTNTVSTTDAGRIERGDTFVVSNESVATVESVSTHHTGTSGQKRVYLGLALETVEYGEFPRFGTTMVRDGATISFEAPEYEFTGRVERVGSTQRRGTPAWREVTLTVENVSPDVADDIQVGSTETSRGETLARITSVRRENATVVLTSDDGNIYERDHPVNEDVTFTANLSVRKTDSGISFKGDTLQKGSTVALHLNNNTVRATVASGV